MCQYWIVCSCDLLLVNIPQSATLVLQPSHGYPLDKIKWPPMLNVGDKLPQQLHIDDKRTVHYIFPAGSAECR